MKDESSQFKRDQLKARIATFMKQEGKPICECGEFTLIGSKYCADCFEKLIAEFPKEVDEYYGSGRNI